MNRDGTPVETTNLIGNIVELENPETWPDGLFEFVSSIPTKPEGAHSEPPEVGKALDGKPIRTYHLTRLTDWEVDMVYRQGLRRASTDLADERLTLAVANGVLTPDQASRRRAASLADEPNRRNYRDVCGTRHPLLDRMRGQVYHLWDNWGGEILYAGLPREERHDEPQPGTPSIVVAVFPVLDWAKYVWPSVVEALWESVHEPLTASGCTIHLENTDLPPETIEVVVQPSDPLWHEWVE